MPSGLLSCDYIPKFKLAHPLFLIMIPGLYIIVIISCFINYTEEELEENRSFLKLFCNPRMLKLKVISLLFLFFIHFSQAMFVFITLIGKKKGKKGDNKNIIFWTLQIFFVGGYSLLNTYFAEKEVEQIEIKKKSKI